MDSKHIVNGEETLLDIDKLSLDDLVGFSATIIENPIIKNNGSTIYSNHLIIILERGNETYRIWHRDYKLLREAYQNSVIRNSQVDELISLIDTHLPKVKPHTNKYYIQP